MASLARAGCKDLLANAGRRVRLALDCKGRLARQVLLGKKASAASLAKRANVVSGASVVSGANAGNKVSAAIPAIAVQKGRSQECRCGASSSCVMRTDSPRK